MVQSQLSVLGKVLVSLRLRHHGEFHVPMIIVCDLDYDSLQGSDFFQEYGCTIFYDLGTFVIQGHEIPIRTRNQILVQSSLC